MVFFFHQQIVVIPLIPLFATCNLFPSCSLLFLVQPAPNHSLRSMTHTKTPQSKKTKLQTTLMSCKWVRHTTGPITFVNNWTKDSQIAQEKGGREQRWAVMKGTDLHVAKKRW